jgi:signal peptidase II
MVRPSFQLRFALRLGALCLLLGVINILIVRYSVVQTVIQALGGLEQIGRTKVDMIYLEVDLITVYLIIFTSIFIAMVMGIGIIVSHRIAGPMVAFQRTFDLIRKGDEKARLELRPNDEFRDIAAVFNDMVDQIQREKDALRKENEDLKRKQGSS